MVRCVWYHLRLMRGNPESNEIEVELDHSDKKNKEAKENAQQEEINS